MEAGMVVLDRPGSHAMCYPWATLCYEGRRVSMSPRLYCVLVCLFDFGSFNAEYPLEVDDDFWETDDPQLAFMQPSDKPSMVIAFNLWLRLTDFAASTLQSLVGAFSTVSSCPHSCGWRISSSTMVLPDSVCRIF